MINSVLAVSVSFLASLLLTPLIIFIAKKKKILDVPSSRKEHKEPKPLMGGVAIFIATIVSSLLFAKASEAYIVPVIIAGAAGVTGMGLIDDILSLSAKRRMVILFIIAICVFYACYCFYLDTQHLVGRGVFTTVVFGVFIVVWIVGITNAINFSDGLDGLASYLSIISTISFAIIFAYQNRGILALPVALALMGAIGGFIPYNRNPAMIFMGDAGSMFIGYMLSLLSISSIRHEYTLYSIIVPIYLLYVPILDMGMSILRRFISGKSIMKPDKMHFHHVLNKKFQNQIFVVIILSLVQIAFAACGIVIFIYKTYVLGWIVITTVTFLASIFTAVTALRIRKMKSSDIEL